jgi:hypothetical protein
MRSRIITPRPVPDRGDAAVPGRGAPDANAVLEQIKDFAEQFAHTRANSRRRRQGQLALLAFGRGRHYGDTAVTAVKPKGMQLIIVFAHIAYPAFC